MRLTRLSHGLAVGTTDDGVRVLRKGVGGWTKDEGLTTALNAMNSIFGTLGDVWGARLLGENGESQDAYWFVGSNIGSATALSRRCSRGSTNTNPLDWNCHNVPYSAYAALDQPVRMSGAVAVPSSCTNPSICAGDLLGITHVANGLQASEGGTAYLDWFDSDVGDAWEWNSASLANTTGSQEWRSVVRLEDGTAWGVGVGGLVAYYNGNLTPVSITIPEVEGVDWYAATAVDGILIITGIRKNVTAGSAGTVVEVSLVVATHDLQSTPADPDFWFADTVHQWNVTCQSAQCTEQELNPLKIEAASSGNGRAYVVGSSSMDGVTKAWFAYIGPR